MKRQMMIVSGLVVVLAVATATYAAGWTSFSYLGSDVWVSFNQVDSKTFTWKFRNDGYRKITYLKFKYSYIDADNFMYTTDYDVFPGSLKPGETFGGWVAFSANSRSQPSISIVEIDRE